MPFVPISEAESKPPEKRGFIPVGEAPPMTADQKALIRPDGIDFSRMSENLPGSTGKALEAMAMPLYRPNQFREGMDVLFKGAGEHILNNFTKVIPGFAEIPTPTKDQIMQGYKDRYGSLDKVKETIETDPAGAALDAISLGVTGLVGARAGGQAMRAAYTDELPISMYESAAKFSTTLPASERKKMVETLLREKIPLTEKGVNKMVDTIETLGEMVDKVIDAADQGVSYPRVAVLRNLQKLKDAKLAQLGGGDDIKIIDKIIQKHLDDIAAVDNPNMTLKEMQQFKKNAYKKINWRDASSKQAVKNEAYKNIARTTKEDIESRVPEVTDLNRRQGDLINALDKVTRSSNRIANRDTLGLDAAIKPGMGAAAAHAAGVPTELGVTLGGVGHVLGRPRIKSSLAQALYDWRRSNPKITDEALVRAMMPAYLAQGREENANP